jgi:transcriptional regulator with XRE-family HTH domain
MFLQVTPSCTWTGEFYALMLAAMEIYEQLAKRVRNLRRELNLTQDGLAFRAGVAQGDISRIECADRKITLLTLAKIAKGLGVTPSELLEEE